jgi:hypothetical protein
MCLARNSKGRACSLTAQSGALVDSLALHVSDLGQDRQDQLAGPFGDQPKPAHVN